MNLKGRPLAIALTFSASILVSITLVSALLTRNQIEAMLSGGPPDPSAMFQNWGLSLFGCLIGILVTGGGGALYAYLHRREAPINGTDAALGGAFTGASAYALSTLASTAITLSFLPQMFDAMNAGTTGPVPSEMRTIMLAGGAIGGLFGVCFAIVLGGLMGAAGGLLSASIFNRSGDREIDPAE